MTTEYYPDPLCKVFFSAATGFVRRVAIRKQPVSNATSGHGNMVANLESGYILIDQGWGILPKEPLTSMTKEQVAEWKKKGKKK